MNNRMAGNPIQLKAPRMVLRCMIPRLTLVPGLYAIHASVWGENEGTVDRLEGAMNLTVEAGPFFRSTDTSTLSYGKCLIDHAWIAEEPSN
jgi:hypothetical protein